MREPAYDAIIPADVRYHPDLVSDHKLLYGEIRALCSKEGYCWATNAYFADLYRANPKRISEWISALRKAGFIRVEIDQQAGNERKIWLLPIPSRRETYPARTGDPIPPERRALYKGKDYKENKKEGGVFDGMEKQTLLESAALSIYNLYPLKVGRPAALRAIKKALKKHSPDFLREKTLEYAALRGGNVNDFPSVPNPATWFNQERFADDPETWKARTTNGTSTNQKSNPAGAKRGHDILTGSAAVAHLY